MRQYTVGTLNDCAKNHPIIVSEIIAKDLPVFWSPRQSLRSQNSGAVVEKKPVVKKERKKPCLRCSCSLGGCSDTKVLMGPALMHFSMHQLKGDNDSEICAYCGKDHDAPTTNSTWEKWIVRICRHHVQTIRCHVVIAKSLCGDSICKSM